MLSKSTNDSFANISKKESQKLLEYTIKMLENEIQQIPKNNNIDGLEAEDSIFDRLDRNHDEQNNQESKDTFNIYCSYKKNIKLYLIGTKNKNKNEVKDTYEIKNIDEGTYLFNYRDKSSEKPIFICQECYQINKKIKLQSNMLLYYLRKKEEKDKILILLK